MTNRPVVMNNVSKPSPPNQQLVGRGTGMAMRSLKRPLRSLRSAVEVQFLCDGDELVK